MESIECRYCNNLYLSKPIFIFLLCSIIIQPIAAQPTPPQFLCRTPGGNEIVVFEPLQFLWGENDIYELITERYEDYEPVVLSQTTSPDPYPDPDCGLLSFVRLTQNPGDMGILYIYTDGVGGTFSADRPGAIALEYYGTPLARWHAVQSYEDQGFIRSDFWEFETGTPPEEYYGLGLRDSGIVRHCRNLKEVMVFADACSTAILVDDWNALVSLGLWPWVHVGDLEVTEKFFMCMLGLINRTTGNYCREVHDAAEFVKEKFGPPWLFSWWNQYGDRVVIAPIVIDQVPYHLETISTSGMVEFDCEMRQEDIQVEDIVMLTGVHTPAVPGPQLQDVHWDDGCNYRIEFTIPPLDDFCWADFLVNPAQAQSAHNLVRLDGNTEPPSNYIHGIAPAGTTNAVAPNDDFYNWTGKVCRNPIIGFENTSPNPQAWHHYGDPIGSYYFGMLFLPSYYYTWLFGETTEGTNTYPYNVTAPYPLFWVDGKWAAFHGEVGDTSMTPVYAKIVYTPNGADSVCFGYKSTVDIGCIALGSTGWIHTETLYANANNPAYPSSYSLSQHWITSPPGHQIDTLKFYGLQNRFLIDNLMVFNTFYDVIGMLPDKYDLIFQAQKEIQPGGDSATFDLNMFDIVDSFQIICHWSSQKGPTTKLQLFDPDGRQVFDTQTGMPPIKVPLIANPLEGIWKALVTSVEIEGKSYPVALVAGARYEPLVDCYIAEDDIWSWFDPNLPILSIVFAKIHAGGRFDKIIENVCVRCYLGDPVQDNRISGDFQVSNLDPGGSDSACFQLETKRCQGKEPCIVTVVVDPENRLEEYNENNNVASKEVIFGN
jgi:hypothetical protein